MYDRSPVKTVLLICLLFAVILSVPVWAAADATVRRNMGRRGMFGDWDLKVQFGDRDMDAILSFSRDDSGEPTADWISFFGVNRLQDVKFEEGKLSFVQVVSFGDQEFRSTFAGTLEDDTLTGVLSGERGDSEVTGKRRPRSTRAAGTWELSYKIFDRDATASLIVTPASEGQLSAEWKSDQVKVDVSDVSYERGTLTFKRKVTMGDRQLDSTFSGTVDRQTGLLEGTITPSEGEVIAVKGTRIGDALIGIWNLDVTGERRQYKQQLRVNPDMSGLYGTLPIEKIEFNDGTVSFKATSQFGDRSFEMSFEGKLADDKLTGQITTSRGTQTVEGTKVVRRFGRRPAGQ